MHLLLLHFLSCLLLYPGPVRPSPTSHTSFSGESSLRRWTNSLFSSIWPLSHDTQEVILSEDDGIPSFPNAREDHGIQSEHYGWNAVVRFRLTSAEDALRLRKAAWQYPLDIWAYTKDWADVRFPRSRVASYLSTLTTALQENARPLFPEALFKTLVTPLRSGPSESLPYTSPPDPEPNVPDIFFQDFQPLTNIVSWLTFLTQLRPAQAHLLSIGKSYQNRTIHGLLVTSPAEQMPPRDPRKTILVIGGVHAREWISTSSVNYAAHHLVSRYHRDPLVRDLVNAFDWVFIPTLNPDGYEYTWKTDRLWRKNRQQTLRFPPCYGIDLDRTWGFQFDSGHPFSGHPCSESYPGMEPWDGVEAEQLRDWVTSQMTGNPGFGTPLREFVSFIDLHSYSQQVLYPYSYSCDELPPTLEDLQELGTGLAKAMTQAKSGKAIYRAESACLGNVITHAHNTVKLGNEDEDKGEEDADIDEVSTKSTENSENLEFLPRLESGGGSALDWFYHVARVRHSFQIKLRDTGTYGFLLPKEAIGPQGDEVVAALLYLGRWLTHRIGIVSELSEAEAQLKGRARPTLATSNGNRIQLPAVVDFVRRVSFW